MTNINSNMNPVNFSERIAYVRKLSGVSRKYIQNNYSIHENTIKKWETGHTNQGEARVRLSTLKEYLTLMEKNFGIIVTEDWLFYGTGSKPFKLWLNPLLSMDSVCIDSAIDLLSQSGYFFFFLNGNMEVTYINPKYAKHLLADPSLVISAPIPLSNIIGVENYTTYYPYFSKALRGKKVEFEFINSSSSSNIKMLISSLAAKNSNKDIIGVFSFINNIEELSN